jgi:surface polysaccharide O-acyltransferase-like enzyme
MNKINRNSAIDFIKVIALFFVFCLHYVEYTGWLEGTFSFGRIIKYILYSIFGCCVPLFFICSGFLMVRRLSIKQHYLKISKVLIMYLCASVLCAIHRLILGWHLFEVIKGIFLFKTAHYSWYVKYYIILYLMIPFINKVLQKNTKKKSCLFIFGLCILSGVGTFFRYSPWVENSIFFTVIFKVIKNLFPIIYYCIGGIFCMQLEQIKIWFEKKRIVLCLCFILLVLNSIIVNLKYKASDIYTVPNGYGSLELIVISSLLFFLMYAYVMESNLGDKKYLVLISNSTLIAYLVSSIFDDIWTKVIYSFFAKVHWYFIFPCVIFTSFFSISIGIACTYVINKQRKSCKKLK